MRPARSTDREAQRARLLDALSAGPITTIVCREQLNIYHPGARVLELREEGHRIVTDWVHGADAWGRTHRIGRYALLRLARRGVAAW